MLIGVRFMFKHKSFTIVFTDSGLGGLSVMADFYERLKSNSKNLPVPPIHIIFFNAQFKIGYGYNQMPTLEEKISIFNRALSAMQSCYKPGLIAIACNTLSSIYPQTDFAHEIDDGVMEIISTGKTALALFKKRRPTLPVAVIVTPATVKSDAYKTEHESIFQVSAANLAGAIENNPNGKIVCDIINQVFKDIKSELLNRNISTDRIALFLGCTHYPYITDKFLSIAQRHDLYIETIINPNLFFSKAVFDRFFLITQNIRGTSTYQAPQIKLSVISQIELQKNEIENISNILSSKYSDIAQSLRSYKYIPDLF
jgi:glutamate racemase